jgi:capsular polysaccharide export protein
MDVAYDLANLAAGRALYAGYRRHELRHPVSEWAGWIGKALAAPRRARARAATLARIAAAKGPVFLLALQLETDFQLRDRGPPDGQRGALARTLASFHARAAPDALLVVKPHPLDPEPGLWRRLSADARVAFLDGGSLEALFPRLAGLVTVNSTAGLSALRAGVSVLALGEAIYDAPGLTHRGGLDGFWTAPERPDPAFVAAFVAALGAIQTPGGFDGEGMRPGAEGVAAMILARRPGARAASAA